MSRWCEPKEYAHAARVLPGGDRNERAACVSSLVGGLAAKLEQLLREKPDALGLRFEVRIKVFPLEKDQ